MKTPAWWRGLAAVLCALLGSGVAPGAVVRGRIQANATKTGVAGVRITVITVGALPVKAVRSAPVFTDSNGMFWIQNVRPGSYNLEVWNSDGSLKAYKIQVAEPVLNVAPIGVGP